MSAPTKTLGRIDRKTVAFDKECVGCAQMSRCLYDASDTFVDALCEKGKARRFFHERAVEESSAEWAIQRDSEESVTLALEPKPPKKKKPSLVQQLLGVLFPHTKP